MKRESRKPRKIVVSYAKGGKTLVEQKISKKTGSKVKNESEKKD